MTTSTRTPANVERMAWPDFLRRFKRRVKAGEHGVLVGSTGSGKSVLAREVVHLFGRNVVVLDAKGGDDPSLNFPGFERITKWPPRIEQDWRRSVFDEARKEPIRVRLAPRIRKMSDLPGMRDTFAGALDDLFTRRGDRVFSIYIDELGVFADPRQMKLGPKVEVLLQQLRYRGGSVVTGMQFPTWLPKPAYRETSHRFFFRVKDRDSRLYLSSITGERDEVEPAMRSLGRFEFLYQDIHADRFVVSKVEVPK